MYTKLRRERPQHVGRKAKAAAAAAAAASAADGDLDADGEFFDEANGSAADEAEDAAGSAGGGGGGKGAKGKRLPAGAKEELRPWLYLVPGLIARGYQVGRVCCMLTGILGCCWVGFRGSKHSEAGPHARLPAADLTSHQLAQASKLGALGHAGRLALATSGRVRRSQPPLCE